MDNERPSEFNAWRQRLEAPNALPGIGLADKEAAWDKLYGRLGEAPRRRTPIWIWAAACLLLALIPVAFLLSPRGKHQQDTGITQTAIRKPGTSSGRTPATTDTSSVVHTPAPAAPGTVTPPANFATVETSPVRSLRPLDTRHTPGSISSAPRTRPVLSVRPVPAVTRFAPQPDSFFPGRPDLSRSIPMVIAAAPPKKELHVVHINELEPPQPAPATAGRRQKAGRLFIYLTPQQEPFRPATTYEPVSSDHHIINFNHNP